MGIEPHMLPIQLISLHWPSSLQKRQVIQLHRVSSIYIVLESALIVKAQWPESRLEKVCEPQVEQFIHHSATSNLRWGHKSLSLSNCQLLTSLLVYSTHFTSVALLTAVSRALRQLIQLMQHDATWCNNATSRCDASPVLAGNSQTVLVLQKLILPSASFSQVAGKVKQWWKSGRKCGKYISNAMSYHHIMTSWIIIANA